MTVSQNSMTPAMGYDAAGAGQGEGQDRPPWGPWATIGLSLVVLVVFVLLQVFTGLVLFFVNMLGDPAFDAQTYLAGLENDGFLLASATTVSALLTTGLIVVLVRRRRGPSVRDYLRLEAVGVRTALVWLAATLALVAASEGLTLLLERPVVPDFMLQIYQTAGVLPLFWLAIVVMAPLFEEVFFRGFLFAGLERSRRDRRHRARLGGDPRAVRPLRHRHDLRARPLARRGAPKGPLGAADDRPARDHQPDRQLGARAAVLSRAPGEGLKGRSRRPRPARPVLRPNSTSGTRSGAAPARRPGSPPT
jgi:membrane protease YdiL (CAAX protease family)